MTRFALAACVAWSITAPALAAAPTQLLPVDDAALASVVLLGAGPTAPVVLVDPQDQSAAERAVAASSDGSACLAGTATAPAVRDLLARLSGAPCALQDDLLGLARRFWPTPATVVVAPAHDYAWLLRGAALAGALGGALLPVDPAHPPSPAALADWHVKEWIAVGAPPPTLALPLGATLRRLDKPGQVIGESVARLGTDLSTVVVANPADRRGHFSPTSLSLLAPLIALSHHAPLVLVSDSAPAVIETEVRRAIAVNRLEPTHIYLVGDELALRSHRVPDPVFAAGGPEALGGGRDVRVELFSEIQEQRPQDYAVGRFVAEDATQGSALLARQLHGAPTPGGIAVMSNADQVFALGETISRTTISELRNAGLPVTAAFRGDITPATIQDAMHHAAILVWEGHARDLTLEEGGGVNVDRTPPLVVLQGCYTFDRSDPFILFERGTQNVVATSAAIYSASGSSFARAFFDAVVYDRADLGTAVRNARNYLLAVAQLKRQRGHNDWTKTYRAALAFALWGDPTSRPPLSAAPPKLAPASWRVGEDALELTVPAKRLKTATVDRYTAHPVPRGMLSGLILRAGDAPEREVKELFYAAVAAPAGMTAACAPAAGWDVITQYAAATRTLFVLARPPGDKPGAGSAAGTYAFPLVADDSDCPRAAPSRPATEEDEGTDAPP